MNIEDINVDLDVDTLKLKRRGGKDKGYEIKNPYLKRIKLQTQVLHKQKMDYVLKVGGSSYELKSLLFKDKAYNNSKLSMKDLQFVKKVKRYIVKNEIYVNFLDQYFPSDISYMDVNPVLQNKKFTNVVEIDVNEAYWKTAYLMGIINQEIYEEGSKDNLGKYTRLVALGALAKRQTHYIYEGGKFVRKEEIRSELTENVWYSICKRLSDVMQGAKKLLGNDYLFYWVDGIYFIDSPKNRKKITSYFLKHGYGCKDVETFMVGFGEKWFAVYNDEYKVKKEFTYIGILNRKITFRDSKRLKTLCKDMMRKEINVTKLIDNKN